MFYVYILKSEPGGGYYIGSAGKDVAQRLAQHNSGMRASPFVLGPGRSWSPTSTRPTRRARGSAFPF